MECFYQWRDLVSSLSVIVYNGTAPSVVTFVSTTDISYSFRGDVPASILI